MDNANSPLFNTRSSLYFKNIASLTPALRSDLIGFLEQGEICKQNKVYFSIDTNGAPAKEEDVSAEICHSLLYSLSAKASASLP